ncbi:uncharacterized protein LOC141627979 [Silene latifolia]|uniref:uncharacterized protein LOC141627979 n=1 Tax=Silene latifolia TaxID=37657 RepID=UPI003D77B621
MRVTGKVRNQEVHVLIESGSTHNFVDEEVARRLGCRMSTTYPLEVSVANGEKILTTKACKGFKWQLHGVKFNVDVMVVPLGGCEMVLGVQWLASLGPVSWDFRELRMDFCFKGKKLNNSRILAEVLNKYSDVFEEPKTLPPHRAHDHNIHLKPGTSPINVRPYRYPVIQKDAIEQNTKEMLENGVVQHSQSPFSSLVVLVKKKDGSWRLCV